MNRNLILILALAVIFCTACAPQQPQASGTPSEPPPVLININGAHMAGDPAAEVVIVEFLDYQCSVCGRHVREVMPQLKTNYIDTGKAAYVYMDFPAERWHPLAFQAAEAANCAADQGEFQQMHDLLLSRQNALREDDLYNHATSLSLDISAFQDCMITNKYADDIRRDFKQGESLNLTGTPTIFIGIPEPGQPDRVRVVSVIRGVGAYPSFRHELELVLASTQ